MNAREQSDIASLLSMVVAPIASLEHTEMWLQISGVTPYNLSDFSVCFAVRIDNSFLK
jgi:hypothetical protein